MYQQKFIVLLLLALVLSNTKAIADCRGKDSLLIYVLPPSNHYLISVTETSIKQLPEVKVIRSGRACIKRKLSRAFVSRIESRRLLEYSEIDARVLLYFKGSKETEIVLINKFGYFISNGKVYDGNPEAIELLQEYFPSVIFMKDLR